MSRTVAVMQPYFYPYAGYFRLLAHADEFVVLDDVQFARRGRVHRCQVPGPGGAEEWLTLPLARQPQQTLIRDLRLADDADRLLAERLSRHAWFERADGPLASRVRTQLGGPAGDDACAFVEAGLRLVADALGLPARISRSSDLGLDPALRGQARIIAIARAHGADRYLNAPGGTELYDAADFAQAGMELEFLPPYAGPFRHLLPALMTQPAARLREDIEERYAGK